MGLSRATPLPGDIVSDIPARDALEKATKALTDALVQVWRACDRPVARPDGSTYAAGNLPETLSYALGLAAKRLGAGTDDEGRATGGEWARDVAGELLVRHRPGSWEAQHVIALVFPPGLIDAE